MNPTDAIIIIYNIIHNVDHPKLIPTSTNLTMKWRNGLQKATSSAARLMGKTQYPRTQTD
jgi:hypothetical protein